MNVNTENTLKRGAAEDRLSMLLGEVLLARSVWRVSAAKFDEPEKET